MKSSIAKGYVVFLREIKQRIRASQYEALKAVNHEMIRLYWDIGRMIVEKQEKEGWGKAVVETLSGDLQKEFPGVQGYSVDNLWRMRKLFLNFRDNVKLAPLVQEISWTKIIVIMESCPHLRMCVGF
jgi:predicted nuclease of restriction endonuclease-like (RecB) superfamily